MNFLHFIFRRLSLILLLLMTVWGVFFYFAILEEVIDETDDTLENYRDILVRSALRDPAILDTHGTLMSHYSFRPITSREAQTYKTRFYDSTVYIEYEDEDEPVRVMESCFRMPDGQFYEVVIKISTLEREDMVEAILGFLCALYVLLLITMLVMSNIVLKRSFKPFDKMIVWLKTIQPDKPVPPLDDSSEIKEFKTLRTAVVDMGNRAYRAYQEQKQFIENASHELQTPLAIVRGKVELLAESESLTEEQMKELDAIYNTLGRAVRLNKSLLLLSRIENKQFTDTEAVVLNEVIDRILPDLIEVYEEKQLRITREDASRFVHVGNVDLFQILITNLLKNALIHSPEGGEVRVLLTSSSLEIVNSGHEPLDEQQVFHRFYHAQSGKKDSTGLGLSIAHSIAESSGLSLTYKWKDGMHSFRLSL